MFRAILRGGYMILNHDIKILKKFKCYHKFEKKQLLEKKLLPFLLMLLQEQIYLNI